MRRTFLPLLLLLVLHPLAQNRDTTFYSVVNLGKVIGENKVWKTTPGEYHFYYHYNDRGRGEVVNSTVNINTNNNIDNVNSSGLDYYKVPYKHSYQKTNDSLITEYNADRTAERDSGQFYIYSEAPAGIGILVKNLLQSPTHKVLTLGGDSVSMKAPIPYNISINNKKIKLSLCEISYSKGSSPSFTWVDDHYDFFADVSNWTNTIRKSYEYLIDTLHALQETRAIPYYKHIYDQLSDALPGKLAIKNVNLFDAPAAKLIPNSTVLIENGIITSVGYASAIKIPPGFTIIDGIGKTLLPGLWDTHGHYNKDDGIGYLSGGITHVRDMGNMPDIKRMQRNIRQHNLLGPDISYLSGFIDKDDEYHGPVGKLVVSQQEAVQAVKDFHKSGYDQIKIYSSIDTGWVKAMCSTAHSLKMRVAGHIPVHMTASKAVLDGYDEITHMNMVMLNFFPDTIDTRKNRFKPAGRSANTIDTKSRTVIDFIQLLRARHTVVEPTINLFEQMYNNFPGDTLASFQPVTGWLKEAWRKNVKVNSFVDDTVWMPAYKKSYRVMIEMLKLLYDNGITLLAGTDGGNQIGLHHELEIFVKAGIPPAEVLKIATYIPAKTFGLDGSFGAIKQNRVADLILVDGDPVQNISDIRRVFMVVTNHSLYYPKKLYSYSEWGYYY